MRRIIVIIAIVIMLNFIVMWAMKDDSLFVRVISVERGVVEETIANTRVGTVKACQRSSLSMIIGGRVHELSVKEGDRVEAEQILLKLWNEDRQAQLDQANAHYEVVRFNEKSICLKSDRDQREAKRLRLLVAKKLVAEDTADAANSRASVAAVTCEAARAERNVALASIKIQQALLDQTILRAPFAGTVAEINGEVGEYITPSPPGIPTPPAVDLIADNCLYISAPIDEVDAAQLRLGLPVRITLDAFRGQIFMGRLTRISPYVLDIEKQARTVDVDVEFTALPDNVILLAGYSADVEVVLADRKDVLRLPTEVILEGDRVFVYNSSDGTIEKKAFKGGLRNWRFVEVISGLSENDKVVSSLDVDGLVGGVAVQLEP